MDYRAETKVLQSVNDQFGASQFPVYLNAAFAYQSPEDLERVFQGQQFGYIYGRIQNPTLLNIERKISLLAGARGSVLTSTGMAAVSGAILTLCSAGDSIIAHQALFGGTIALFDTLFKKLGLNIVYVDFHNLAALQQALAEAQSPALLFCESMGNPALDIQDLEAVGNIAQERRLPLLLDATLTPPGFLDLSGNLVALEIHSSTKFMAGNGSVLGGVVIDRGTYDWGLSPDPLLKDYYNRFGRDNAFLAAFRFQALQNMGMTQQPLAATITGFGIESMKVRVEQQNRNAAELATHLETGLATGLRESVKVHYPGLKSSPYYDRAMKFMPHGAGSLMTLDLGNKERAYAFGRALKLAKNMTNLGDVRTLVVHPDSTIFKDASEEQKKQAGVSQGLMRISLGLEHIEDLKADFSRAVEEAHELK